MSEGTLTLLDSTDVMLRQINKGLMVRWINRDLMNRAANDVRSSMVLYDADRMFVGALPPEVTDAFVAKIAGLLRESGVRFYSRGIV